MGDGCLNDFVAFLRQHRVEKGSPSNIVSHLTPKGSYLIEGADRIEFWRMYNEVISQGHAIGLNETNAEELATPLHLDFDFKHSTDGGVVRHYTPEHVKAIVRLYQEIIEAIVDSAVFDKKMCICFVSERDEPRVKGGYVKDGLHFHFPFFHADVSTQNVIIRTKALKYLEERKVFDNMALETPLREVVDPIGGKAWMIYGSIRERTVQAYKITHIYDYSVREVELSTLYPEFLKDKDKPAEYYLPQLMSLHTHEVATKLNDDIIKIKQHEIEKEKPRRRRVNVNTNHAIDSIEQLKTIEDGNLLGMLNAERADNYAQWIDVGWTLFSIGKGCAKALDMWIEFSKRSAKFRDGACEDAWNHMEMKPGFNGKFKSIGTIYSMASKDNPDEYNEWRQTNLDYVIDASVRAKEPTHVNVARIMHRMYSERFICTSLKKNTWYEFSDHVWNQLDEGVTMQRIIMEEIPKLYRKKSIRLTQHAMEEPDNADKMDAKNAKCLKMITALGKVPFIKGVMDACKVLFHDKNFYDKLDENRNLIAFRNGVLDLEHGIFREGRTDDYISMRAGVEYVEYEEDDDDVRDVKLYLRQVFPNPNIRDYFMGIVASCLKGGNDTKTVCFWTGNGNNSKSVAMRMVENVFGELCMKFPRELMLMSNKVNSSGPRDELVRSRGKRIAFTQEIAESEKLNVGVIKELSGSDSFTARGLFEKTIEIKPQFTLMAALNNLPPIPSSDDATWNRIRVIEFQSRFPKNPAEVPESEEEQWRRYVFPCDPDFDAKFTDMLPAFAWLLVERYKRYMVDGLKEPNEVLAATNRYRENNDVYRQFIKQCIVKVEDQTQFIKLQDTYTTFLEFYSINYPSYSKGKIGKMKFKSMMESLPDIGPIGKLSRWYGFALKMDEEKE